MLKMRGNRVGVERVGKSNNKTSFVALPEDTSVVGIIRYVGDQVTDPDLAVGTKVYYGKDRQEIKVQGTDILVMPSENIIGIAESPSA